MYIIYTIIIHIIVYIMYISQSATEQPLSDTRALEKNMVKSQHDLIESRFAVPTYL